MHYNEPQNLGNMRGITPSVKFLLILNIAVFLLEFLFKIPLSGWFALPADWWRNLSFGQLFTYMFIHAGPSHLLMNMLGLYFIGPTVERTLGSYRFFILYYLSGILGGLGWSLLAEPYVQVGHQLVPITCVGASGAIMGILGAFGAFYPNARVYLIFLPFVPLRAWVVVLGLALLELYQTFGHPIIGGVANSAHLIGGIAGFGYAYQLKHPHVVAELKSRWGKKKPPQPQYRPRPKTAPQSEQLSKEEIDAILDKIGKQGMGALTHRERELLKRATRG